MQTSALENLRGSDPKRWSRISEAARLSQAKTTELAGLVEGLVPPDEGSFVVFGSLSRGEYTTGSDLDWTVLIDGRADSKHLDIVRSVKPKLKAAGFDVPGPTEVFGGLIFSHDLVHAIGGDEDTNRNMTRRLLMLLESTAVDVSLSRDVHARILRAILGRYVEEDANFIVGNRGNDRIPRFLLNDVVRFWRTMAVDYANKYRARGGEKWALRNIKLRMSRKLIFVSGLLMCVSWALDDHHEEDDDLIVQKLIGHLEGWTKRTPLESLALVVETYAPSLAGDIFDNYDAFLAILGDDAQRDLLQKLSPEEAYENDVFLSARGIATDFDKALTSLIFDSNPDISRLVKKYGVF